MTEDPYTEYREPSPGAAGLIIFAGTIMIMIGIFHAISGFVALIQSDFYVVAPNHVFEFDTTSWGWIHLIAGIVVLLAGFGVLAGQTWARVVGIMCGDAQRHRQLHVHPLLPHLVDPDHRPGCLCHLGLGGARPGVRLEA